MRITLIVERFTPEGGGVEHVVWSVAHGLRDRGDRVRVLAREGRPAPGIEVESVPVPAFWQPARVGLFSHRTARRIDALRGGGEVDVVHSFCRTVGADVFHAGGGSHADYMQNTYGSLGAALRRGSPRHAVQLDLERRIFDDPGVVIQCPSRMVAREIGARFGVAEERLRVLPNGVDAERFAAVSASEAAATRAEIGDDTHATVWLLAGSGWRRKGLDVALAALARRRDPDTRLWIAGSDPVRVWQARAERLGVADRVRFLGPRADLERVMAASDGLLLPTRYDAFGLVCLEAAAAGRPVVTSRRAGAAEVLGDAAEVVDDPGDVDALVRALDRLADPAERKRRGEAGRALASRLDWPHQVEALRDLYRERVVRRTRRPNGPTAQGTQSAQSDASTPGDAADPAAVGRAAERFLGGSDPDARVLADNPRRQLVRLDAGDGLTVLLKRFRRPRRRDLRTLRGDGAAEREWKHLEWLARWDGPAPRPLVRGRWKGDSWLALELVEGPTLEALARTPRAERRRALAAVARAVAALHGAGLVHGDLHVGNVIVSPDGPRILDFQRARRSRRPSARRRDWGALDFSLRHHGFSIGDRVAFRIAAAAALGDGLDGRPGRRRFVADVARASLDHARRYYASRTRRSERPGRRFARVHHDGERGLRAAGFGDDELAACLDRQSRLAMSGEGSPHDEDLEVLKRDHRSVIVALRVGSRSVVVKEVVKRGRARRLADVFRGSPARRAWRAGYGLEARGLRVARPLAFVERRWLGVPVRSRLVVEDLRPARAASDEAVWRAHPDAARAALLHLLVTLHHQGVEHGDLQALHVYLAPADTDSDDLEAVLIDLEAVRFHRALGDRRRLEALAELNASLPPDFVSAEDRRDLFTRYVRALPFSEGEAAALAQVVQMSLARRHHWSGEGCAHSAGVAAVAGAADARDAEPDA